MGETIEAAAPKKPRVALWIATGCGLGYLPVAPGTWGSLGGVALAWAVPRLVLLGANAILQRNVDTYFISFNGLAVPSELGVQVVAGIVVGLVGVWASRHAALHLRNSDPAPVVIDEISGQLITYLPLGALRFAGGGWKYVLLGFVLFRVFDIVKPWPARQAERWPHGWGIMADDWFAGLYAAAVLWIVKAMVWIS